VTPKQRVRAALARKQPDRLPANVSFNTDARSGPLRVEGPSAREKILRHLGTDDYEQVLRRLGIDVRVLGPRPAEPGPDGQARLGEFAEGVQRAECAGDLRRLPRVTWDLLWDLSHLREDVEHLLALGEYAIEVPGPSPWEWARIWRGFEQVMVDWMTEPEFVVTLCELVLDCYLPAYDVFAEELGDLAGQVDTIYAGSDFGMQDRPMVSPELFERDYAPLIAREARHLKARFPNAAYEYHCCGSVAELLPAMVRAGVEVLHPVQPAAKGMGFAALKAHYGDRLAFRGGVDAQGVMARGTPEDVRRSALHAFHTLGKGGGFILSPHGIMPEVPVENVLALFDVVGEECWY